MIDDVVYVGHTPFKTLRAKFKLGGDNSTGQVGIYATAFNGAMEEE